VPCARLANFADTLSIPNRRSGPSTVRVRNPMAQLLTYEIA
jgi:hypothetical protein